MGVPSPEEARLDQRNRVTCDCVPGEWVRGERRGVWEVEEDKGVSLIGISFGGAFTGETMALGRTSCGAPAGMGTLWTIGTGPPVSMVSSRLVLELLDSLTESSESLLLEELELELARLCAASAVRPLADSAVVSPFPVGRGAVVRDGGTVFDGNGLGGAGMDARIAAVDIVCRCFVGVVCGCLLRPLRDEGLSGSETMRGLAVLGVVCGFCLARATALVIFATATADTFVAGLAVFFTPPPDLTTLVLELPVVVDVVEWITAVADFETAVLVG